MSILNVVQKVTRSVSNVYSDIQTLINDNGIESDEVKFVKVVPFGSQFLSIVVYAYLRELRILKSSFGIKTTLFSKILTFRRGLTTKIGLTSIVNRIIRIRNSFSSSCGMSLNRPIYKLSTEIKSGFGLKSAISRLVFMGNSKTSSIGFSVNPDAEVNGVPIIFD